MTVEIKELVIRAVVSSENKNGTADGKRQSYAESDEKEMLVTECVEQVMKILKKSRER